MSFFFFLKTFLLSLKDHINCYYRTISGAPAPNPISSSLALKLRAVRLVKGSWLITSLHKESLIR